MKTLWERYYLSHFGLSQNGLSQNGYRCGVKKKKATLQLLSSGPCAPHSFGVESPSPIGGPASRSRSIVVPMPPTTSQRWPAMVSRWLRLVRLWNSLRQLPHAEDNHQRVVRHVSQVARDEPVHFPPCLQVRFDCSESVNTESRCAPVPISLGVDPPVGHHSVDMKMTSSGKWHFGTVLQSSSSFRHCCIFGQLPRNVKSSLEWIHALCCSSSLASPSSQGGGAFAMLVFDVQMLWTGMMSAGSSSSKRRQSAYHATRFTRNSSARDEPAFTSSTEASWFLER